MTPEQAEWRTRRIIRARIIDAAERELAAQPWATESDIREFREAGRSTDWTRVADPHVRVLGVLAYHLEHREWGWWPR